MWLPGVRGCVDRPSSGLRILQSASQHDEKDEASALTLGLPLLFLAILASTAQLAANAQAVRDRAQVRAFRAENPCPVTGRTRGACPGWHVDHVTPLCAGGADRPHNMQWITKEDHRFKTYVDVRECRKARKLNTKP